MPLVSMKTNESSCEAIEPNPYSYGLRICLNDDQCEALGIKTPPAAGTKMMLSAAAFVCEATQRVETDGDDKGPDITLELQITDMELTTGTTQTDVKSLYPNSTLL
jgi:hypothetical protein